MTRVRTNEMPGPIAAYAAALLMSDNLCRERAFQFAAGQRHERGRLSSSRIQLAMNLPTSKSSTAVSSVNPIVGKAMRISFFTPLREVKGVQPVKFSV